ncbi:MAG TPA: glucokinase, partial [Stenotrophomonas sp.]|nr:glucokinase [Stenotrophomonas sp.]
MQTFPFDSASRPFLAADVGGTHVRLGLIRAGSGEGRAIEILSYRKYRCADHASLSAILSDFASHHPPVEHCVIATAGYALADGTVISANLPWPLSANRIRDDLGFQAVHLV